MSGIVSSQPWDEQFPAYVSALLQGDGSLSVFDALDSLRVPKPYSARMKVLYSAATPAAVLNALADGAALSRLSGTTPSFCYTCSVGRKPRREIRVSFVVLAFPDQQLDENVQAVVSVCRTEEWNALRRFLRHQYPDLVPVLLSQRELIDGARRLRRLTGHSVQVRSYSTRERIASPRSREWESGRGWTDKDLNDVVFTVQDRHQVITSIDVEFFAQTGAHRNVLPSAVCKIRKTGEIEVDGSFRLAFNAVAAEVARVGYEKLSLFSGRGLRESKYAARPLAITYAQPIFDDSEAVRSLVQLLSRYPRSMHAVQHGNPYAHVKLTDTADFSSFEVWAIPPSRLALIPGLRASPAAFERLIDYVFDRFREGEVADYRHG